jgi:hypothetical protein
MFEYTLEKPVGAFLEWGIRDKNGNYICFYTNRDGCGFFEHNEKTRNYDQIIGVNDFSMPKGMLTQRRKLKGWYLWVNSK